MLHYPIGVCTPPRVDAKSLARTSYVGEHGDSTAVRADGAFGRGERATVRTRLGPLCRGCVVQMLSYRGSRDTFSSPWNRRVPECGCVCTDRTISRDGKSIRPCPWSEQWAGRNERRLVLCTAQETKARRGMKRHICLNFLSLSFLS